MKSIVAFVVFCVVSVSYADYAVACVTYNDELTLTLVNDMWVCGTTESAISISIAIPKDNRDHALFSYTKYGGKKWSENGNGEVKLVIYRAPSFHVVFLVFASHDDESIVMRGLMTINEIPSEVKDGIYKKKSVYKVLSQIYIFEHIGK